MSFASKKLWIAAIVSTAFCGSALAANTGWYFAPSVGATVLQDTKVKNKAGVEAKVESKTGFNGGLAVGTTQGPMSYEVEALYVQAKANKMTMGGSAKDDVSGKTKVTAGMVNALYNFEQADTPFMPYVGLGIGYAKVKQDVKSGTTKELHDSDSVFAYQAKLGVNYKIDDAMAVGLGYSYFGTGKAKFKLADNEEVKDRIGAHNFAVSLKWMF